MFRLIQIYHQNVGAGEPLVAIVADFETKKSKVKVFQANQHVGHQVRLYSHSLHTGTHTKP